MEMVNKAIMHLQHVRLAHAEGAWRGSSGAFSVRGYGDLTRSPSAGDVAYSVLPFCCGSNGAIETMVKCEI